MSKAQLSFRVSAVIVTLVLLQLLFIALNQQPISRDRPAQHDWQPVSCIADVGMGDITLEAMSNGGSLSDIRWSYDGIGAVVSGNAGGNLGKKSLNWSGLLMYFTLIPAQHWGECSF